MIESGNRLGGYCKIFAGNAPDADEYFGDAAGGKSLVQIKSVFLSARNLFNKINRHPPSFSAVYPYSKSFYLMAKVVIFTLSAH